MSRYLVGLAAVTSRSIRCLTYGYTGAWSADLVQSCFCDPPDSLLRPVTIRKRTSPAYCHRAPIDRPAPEMIGAAAPLVEVLHVQHDAPDPIAIDLDNLRYRKSNMRTATSSWAWLLAVPALELASAADSKPVVPAQIRGLDPACESYSPTQQMVSC